MQNILIKKHKELEINTNIGLAGEWMIEIVHPNGEIERPFGDKMRPNLLVNAGLDRIFQPGDFTDRQFTIASNFINTALYGNGTSIPQYTDTGLQSQIASTTTVTQPCYMTDNQIEGSRSFTKIFDFAAVGSTTTIREIGIRANNTNVPTVTALVSRFLLPEPVTLTSGRFLRLIYTLRIAVPYVVSPLDIFIDFGSFNPSGQLKCVGQWRDIFGSMLPNGQTGTFTTTTEYTGNPFSPNAGTSQTLLPFHNSTTGGNGQGAGAGLINENIPFPELDTDLAGYTVIGSVLTNAASIPLVGAISMSTYAAGSHTQDATYVFSAGNPNSIINIGGILFRTKFSVYTDGRPPAGWYWKFNNPQIKALDYGFAINMRQFLFRIN